MSSEDKSKVAFEKWRDSTCRPKEKAMTTTNPGEAKKELREATTQLTPKDVALRLLRRVEELHSQAVLLANQVAEVERNNAAQAEEIARLNPAMRALEVPVEPQISDGLVRDLVDLIRTTRGQVEPAETIEIAVREVLAAHYHADDSRICPHCGGSANNRLGDCAHPFHGSQRDDSRAAMENARAIVAFCLTDARRETLCNECMKKLLAVLPKAEGEK